MGYAALNLAVAALAADVKPRRLVNGVVALLFVSNGGLALAVAARVAATLPPWLFPVEGLLNAASVAAFVVLPFLFPRRRLSRRGERSLFALVGGTVAAYGAGVLLQAVGLLPLHAAERWLLDPLFSIGLLLGTLLLLDAYLGSHSLLHRDQLRFFLAAFGLKVGVQLRASEFAQGWPWLLAYGVVLAAVPLGLAASHARHLGRSPRPRPLAHDAFVLGVMALAFVLPLGARSEVEWLLLRPVLLSYGMLRYQLLDVDLRQRWGLLAAAVLAGVGVVFAAATRALLDLGADAASANAFALVAALGAGAAAAWPVARVVLRRGVGGWEARDREVYRAALEAAFSEPADHAASHDRVLRALRGRLGVSEREAALAEAEVRASLGAAGPEEGGRFLGRYRVKALLGEGGYGRTFLALDEAVGREVVLKVARAPSPGERKRVLREARILARIQHPAIVTVFDVEEVAGEAILVLEYVEGGSLADRLARGPLRPEDLLPVADRVLQALDAAHREGVVHRDVKPANILLSAAGEAKLADFGVAGALEGAGTMSGFTVAAGNPGTLRYMSPEQVRGVPLDGRSDLYSLGAVLYEALTGRSYLDLERRTWLDAVTAIQEEEPALPVEGLPEPWSALLAELLAKDPQARPAGAQAVRARLGLTR